MAVKIRLARHGKKGFAFYHIVAAYFSGNYPTPGGVKMVNQAFINYIEQLYQF